jgi:hypothetical protein
MTDNGNGHSTNGHGGYSGTSLFLMFLGGALAGAAAAYLAQSRNREQVGRLAGRAQHAVGQLPQAVQEASLAAKEAFVEAYDSPGEVVPAIASTHA